MQSDVILKFSQNINAKVLTLIIMEANIKVINWWKTKWRMLSADQQTGIRQYMMNIVITLGQQQTKNKSENDILQRANSIIVQVSDKILI